MGEKCLPFHLRLEKTTMQMTTPGLAQPSLDLGVGVPHVFYFNLTIPILERYPDRYFVLMSLL